jgi:hypothetical protein
VSVAVAAPAAALLAPGALEGAVLPEMELKLLCRYLGWGLVQ